MPAQNSRYQMAGQKYFLGCHLSANQITSYSSTKVAAKKNTFL